ncbi:MAG: type II toxin-antitoxin system RelE/ParE family toxin [Candidatus Sulfotelmatobacter sp.]
MPVAKQYEDAKGKSPYAKWFDDLHAPAAAKITKAVARMEQGNFSNVTGVGSGVYENTIDFGPGYRFYFGKDGEQLIILLAGGSKKRQQGDIN